MAEDVSAVIEQQPTIDRTQVAEHENPTLMWGLLIAGTILILFAYGIGQITAEQCDSLGNNCHWSSDDVDRNALTAHIVGALLIMAGLIERLLLGMRSIFRPHP